MTRARAEAVRNIKSAADRINRQAVDKQRIGNRYKKTRLKSIANQLLINGKSTANQ